MTETETTTNESNDTSEPPAGQEIAANELAQAILKVLRAAKPDDANGSTVDRVNELLHSDEFRESVVTVLQEDYDVDAAVEEGFENMDIAQIFHDNFDPDDWNLLTSDNFDICDYEYEINDWVEYAIENHDSIGGGDVEEQVTSWIESGCGSVDTYAHILLQRALTKVDGTIDDHNQQQTFVFLTLDEFTRIQKAVARLEEIGLVEATAAEPPSATDQISAILSESSDPMELAAFTTTAAAEAQATRQVLLNTMTKPQLLAEAERLGISIIGNINAVTKTQILTMINGEE